MRSLNERIPHRKSYTGRKYVSGRRLLEWGSSNRQRCMGAQMQLAQNNNVPLDGGTLYQGTRNYGVLPHAVGAADFFAYFLL